VYTKIHEDCGKRLATTPKIETLRVYLLNAAEISDKKAFIEMIQQNLTPNFGERVMTIGQLFKEEGRQVGHIEAQKDIARNMLENGMGIEMVSRLTKLPISVIQAIEKELKQAQH
jgi:predicted transposase YdaD